MRIVDIIQKKRDNQTLTKEEIHTLITKYVNKEVPDYQVSAWLMAVYFNGMTQEETNALVSEMLYSGDTIDLSGIDGVKLDKHSTGGVGDKTSLVLGPLVAACGGKLAKMSGRGLGHTGGTLDKLEAIDGFKINISEQDFFDQVNDIGVAIVGQDKNLVPADKLLYALRDVTATVDSIPLIAASIMSKKLASGADKIVLDVKVGSGAFMKTTEQAEELAKVMVEIGKGFGKEVVAFLTNMDQVLGHAVGNAIEVEEAIATLKGEGPKDFTELVYAIAEELLILAGIDHAKQKIQEAISSGAAMDKFLAFVKAQGGDVSQITEDRLPKAKKEIPFYPTATGVVSKIDAKEVGRAAMLLGAGRATKEDTIDMAVGLKLFVDVGDAVTVDEPIGIIYANHDASSALEVLNEAIQIANEGHSIPTILKIVK